MAAMEEGKIDVVVRINEDREKNYKSVRQKLRMFQIKVNIVRNNVSLPYNNNKQQQLS